MNTPERPLTVLTTAPPALDAVVDAVRWSEQLGCRGALVYTDNLLVDPWTVAHLSLSVTSTFVPLVAVQPIYEHPFSVANRVATLAALHGRSVDLNFVTGGFEGHRAALGDTLGHDERYDRLREHASVVCGLLNRPTTTYDGHHYTVQHARTPLRLAQDVRPRVHVSGSSAACAAAATALGAVQLSYPTPVEEFARRPADRRGRHGTGIRIGIIARDTSDSAWRLAQRLFPENELGRQLHDRAAASVSSSWHQDLSGRAPRGALERETYWLHPFHTYQTFCPYLVGSHDEVAAALARYLDAGVRTLILDVPASFDDLGEAMVAIRRADDLSRPTTRQGVPQHA